MTALRIIIIHLILKLIDNNFNGIVGFIIRLFRPSLSSSFSFMLKLAKEFAGSAIF